MNELLSIVIPLFILMDFIGTVPLFISLTSGFTKQERRRTAFVSSLIACSIVLAFALLGRQIMTYFDLSIPALKVGGGLLLMGVAFERIFAGPSLPENIDKFQITVSPLAIPMLAGPGSMSFAMITFIELHGPQKVLVPFAILLVFITGSLIFNISSGLHKILGDDFVRGLEKVMAVLLAIIASEMILDGVKRYFF